MLKVFVEKDLVILDLSSRMRDVLLTCSDSETLENTLRMGARSAELNREAGLTSVFLGEPWGAKVLSFDRRVTIRFIPPLSSTATRVPLSPEAARALSDQIKFVREQAAYGIRFTTEKV